MVCLPNRRTWVTQLLALLLLGLVGCDPAPGDELDELAPAAPPGPVEAGGPARQVTPGPSSRIVTVVKAGSRRGVVRADVGQLGCTGTLCLGAYPQGTRLTLTAEPYAGGAFSGWLGACSGIGPCTVELTADVTVTADFTGGPNFAFVTSQPVGGDFGGLNGGDGICQSAAQQAGLPGSYVALLNGTNTESPLVRLAGSRGWVRTDGKIVADTVDELRTVGPRYPVRLDERGVDHASDLFDLNATVTVWTGTNYAAGKQPGAALPGTLTYTCDGWTTNRSGAYGGLGSGTASGVDFLASYWAHCSAYRARLFCFGTGNQAEVAAAPIAGRLAFVSQGAWVPAGGLEGADRTCQTQAQAAGRTGRFRALLATPTASAASRFSTLGARWVRVDGVPLTARGDSLQTEAIPFEAPPLLDLRGQHVSPGFWLGATALRAPGSPSSTCSGWTLSDPSARGRAGQSSAFIAPLYAFGAAEAYCSGSDGGAHGLLCLQE